MSAITPTTAEERPEGREGERNEPHHNEMGRQSPAPWVPGQLGEGIAQQVEWKGPKADAEKDNQTPLQQQIDQTEATANIPPWRQTPAQQPWAVRDAYQ